MTTRGSGDGLWVAGCCGGEERQTRAGVTIDGGGRLRAGVRSFE
ncbi:hypothetical protein OROGR_020738 [Orobanche gracilis]